MPQRPPAAAEELGISTREYILREASKLFGSRGFQGTSTRDIAAAVGVRQPSVYSHFSSKQEIAEELLHRDLTSSNVALEAIAVGGGGAPVELYRYMRWQVRYVQETDYDLTGLYLGDLLNLPEFTASRELLADYDALIASIIRRGIDEGDFLDQDPIFLQAAVDALVHEAIRRTARQSTPVAGLPDLTAELTVRALMRRQSKIASVRATANRLDNKTE